MKKTLFLLAALTVCAFPLRAQDGADETTDQTPKYKTTGIMGYFSFGAVMYDIGALNTALTDMGFAEQNPYALTYGGGGYLIRKNFVIGGEGHSAITTRQENTRGKTKLEGGYGMFRLGYMVLSKRKVMMFPALGVGGRNYQLTLQPTDSVPTFGQTLTTPGQMSVLSTRGMLLDASLNANFYLIGDGNNGGGLSLGLTAGYMYAPGDAKWELGETQISGGPASTFAGPYFRLSIVGGGIVKN